MIQIKCVVFLRPCCICVLDGCILVMGNWIPSLGAFLQEGYPQIIQIFIGFPRNKPSSYLGPYDYGDPQIGDKKLETGQAATGLPLRSACPEIDGGFEKWTYPSSWLVYFIEIHPYMDDLGLPWFRKPPYGPYVYLLYINVYLSIHPFKLFIRPSIKKIVSTQRTSFT